MSPDPTKFLQFALDTALDAVYVCDKGGRIHYVNPSACKSLGYSCKELIGMTIFEIDPDLQRHFWDKNLEICRQIGGLGNIEGTHRRKDGVIIPVEVSLNLQYIDGVEYSCSIVRDVSERKAAKKEMERLRFAVDNANDAVCLYDKEARIQYANASACNALGYSYDELTSMTLADINPTFRMEDWAKRWSSTLQGIRESIQSVHRRKDGSTFPVEISFGAKAISDEDYAIAFARDISDRVETERNLRLLELTVDNAGDGVYVTKSTGEIIYVNKTATQMLGYSKEEMIGMKLNEIDPGFRETDWVEESDWDSLSDVAQILQTTHRRKDGTLFPVEIAGVGMSFEGQQYGCGITRDITERLETERRLRFLEFAIDNSGDAIYIGDAAGRLLYVNEAASRMLGYTKRELLSMNLDQIDPSLKDARWDSDEWWDQFLTSPTSFESVHRSKDGILIPVDVVGAGLVFEQRRYGFSAVRDISERKRTEEELRRYREHLEELVDNRTAELKATQDELLRKEKLAVLGQLTGTVAHELRNPLGTIRSSLYLIRDRAPKDDAPLGRAVQRAERNIVRCDKLIDELLDFTRTRKLELETVAVDTWLPEVVLSYEVPDTINIEFDLVSEAHVAIDDERFRRCIINLLSNACDAMATNAEDKPSVLRLSSKMDGERVIVNIADTGVGISEEKLQKIFEPLFSTKAFGVGLGLPIIEQIVQQHHGGVTIKSTEGEGTCVSLWLPQQGNA